MSHYKTQKAAFVHQITERQQLENVGVIHKLCFKTWLLLIMIHAGCFGWILIVSFRSFRQISGEGPPKWRSLQRYSDFNVLFDMFYHDYHVLPFSVPRRNQNFLLCHAGQHRCCLLYFPEQRHKSPIV